LGVDDERRDVLERDDGPPLAAESGELDLARSVVDDRLLGEGDLVEIADRWEALGHPRERADDADAGEEGDDREAGPDREGDPAGGGRGRPRAGGAGGPRRAGGVVQAGAPGEGIGWRKDAIDPRGRVGESGGSTL